MKLKFVVNRKRSDWDGEPTYDRFTRQVPGIVYAMFGLDCSPDWYFDLSPVIVKEV